MGSSKSWVAAVNRCIRMFSTFTLEHRDQASSLNVHWCTRLKPEKNAHRSHLKQVQPATLNISFSETNTKQWPAYLKLTKHWKKKSPCLNAWRAFLWRQHKLPPRTSHSHIYKQLHLTHKSLEFLRNHQKRQHNQDTQEVPKKKKNQKCAESDRPLCIYYLQTDRVGWLRDAIFEPNVQSQTVFLQCYSR